MRARTSSTVSLKLPAAAVEPVDERESVLALLFAENHTALVRLATLLGAGSEAEDMVSEALSFDQDAEEQMICTDMCRPGYPSFFETQFDDFLHARGRGDLPDVDLLTVAENSLNHGAYFRRRDPEP